jgi:hypothetical protein
MLKLRSFITKNYFTTPIFLIITATFLSTLSSNSSATQIKLAWKSDEANEGFTLHYGPSRGNYTHHIDVAADKTERVGDKIAHQISGLKPGTYYFAVQSHDEEYIRYSQFSEEIIITIPPYNESTSSQANDDSEMANGPNPYTEVSLNSEASQSPLSEADSQLDGAVAAQTPIIELGEADIDHTWTRVAFNESFTDPIIIAKPLSYNDEAPATVAIRNVDSTGFDIRVQKWADLDSEHTPEKVSYLAIERGTYLLPDGTRLEADQQETLEGSASIEVPFLQEYQVAPVVIASITSDNSETPLTSRLQRIGTEGFEIFFQDEDTPRIQELNSNETFAYIAWEPSSGTTGGVAFEINRTPDAVGSDFYPVEYQQQPLESPLFIADIQTVNNERTANLRWQNKDSSGIEVKVESPLPQDDNEAEFVPESVGYAAFGIASDEDVEQ